MIGETLGHYEIRGKIGAGGMGVVYRAHDRRLDRAVAIKVLPANALTDENVRKRFRKEAHTLSGLNHPNIAVVYDLDREAGVDFMVMELVPGDSLADRLRGGPFPAREVASLGAQIADALDEAHEHQVIHRDLKPANVMVTPKGRVKVLDFGLARMLRPVGALSTESIGDGGEVSGTLPYMSPEQVCGESMDGRSDIFSLGATLYEMSTGTRPFREENLARLLNQIQREQPAPPRSLNPQMPAELERIILKCLEKQPDHRYQSAREVAVDLRQLAGPVQQAVPEARVARASVFGRPAVRAAIALAGVAAIAAAVVAFHPFGRHSPLLNPGAPGRIRSLAVLPLQNLSRDRSQDFFAEGMTDELITDLGQIGALRVTSQTSVMQYENTRKTVPQIARELGVDAVVEGSVLQSQGRVRISADLVDARLDRHLWARSYERDLRDVLSLQDEVARAIADQIRVELTPEEHAQLTRQRPVDPEAFQNYLRGQHFLNAATSEEDIRTAMSYFQATLARDPGSAFGHAGLANANEALADFYRAPREVIPVAEAEAAKALAVDNSLADAHAALGWAKFIYDWDWPVAEREFKRAIELNPGLAIAHDDYANFLLSFGRFDQSFAESRRATELDPLSVLVNMNRGFYYFMARDYNRAIEQEQRTLHFQPDCPNCDATLAMAYAEKGDKPHALVEAHKADRYSDSPLVRAEAGRVFAISGDRADAERLAGELVELTKKRFICPYEIATTYVGLGQIDEAFRWLEKGYQQRSVCMIFLKVDPRLDSIRGDPRYAALMNKVGFQP
jgi:TolB-like protein/Tfp pilus assembly protein PilF